MANTYLWSLMGLSVIFFTVMIQSIAAAIAHAKAPGAVPGKLCDNLSHDSFVFRSHRTFHNSLENLLIFAGPALIAIFAGVSEFTLSAIIWVYAIARVVHMLLYYFIATEKNPSPRSYFYLIGLVANLALFAVLAYHFTVSF
ncbi:MAPEG family protein [Aestuariibacter sp. A3R04]|uniref:MAPEG family protein n=1 Tax=Aestuariibacter sp. A3R04 TaxID=2841571 RepID=UPI001C0864A6|nr:MAPEG family protein [Aestuariibacter sp. A3R04]MBU3024008.1 MAPEG family protein [Aestuariibacter sp. A3R04]